jgi:hypothetical protein
MHNQRSLTPQRSAFLLALLFSSLGASAEVFSLRAGFSDNMPWAMPWGVQTTHPYFAGYWNVGTPIQMAPSEYAWETPQMGFALTPAGPAVFKSNGTELFPHFWDPGDVVAHVPGGGTLLIFDLSTSGQNYFIDISLDLCVGVTNSKSIHVPLGWKIEGPWGGSYAGSFSGLGRHNATHVEITHLIGSYFYLTVGGNDGNNYDFAVIDLVVTTHPIPATPTIFLTTLAGRQLVANLSWPTNQPGTTLESAPTPIGPWAPLFTPWVTNADSVSVQVTNDASAQFFRLSY